MSNNEPMTTGRHDAAASAIGYLYQTQWPLEDLIRRSRDEPDCVLALELVDDVAWMENSAPRELVQSKHHIERSGGLGDMSVDLWRTLAVWMDAHDPGDPSGPTLTLVTTSVAAPGSAAHAFRTSGSDPEAGRQRLERAASQSTSAATQVARVRFLGLPEAARSAFVSRIRVLDGSPGIEDLDAEVRKELHLVLPRGREDMFLGQVWDWWIRRAISLLTHTASTVSGLELHAAIDRMRNEFSDDNLPTTVPREAFDAGSIGSYDGRIFVRQLDFVGPPTVILERSIQDYYRSITQSAVWIENNLVDLPEVTKFKEDLRDEWERVFAWAVSRLPAEATDDEKRQVGRGILERCLDSSEVALRPQYREAFFFRGKLQEISDERLIGWHPEYGRLLDELLAGTTP
jgi:hypothetical protein